VAHLDIDELIVAEGGQTVFERVMGTTAGAMFFFGNWIDGVSDGNGSTIRHRDFRYTRKDEGVCSPKWAAVPRLIPYDVQIAVHGFAKGFKRDFAPDIRFRHFRRISTSWKFDRSQFLPYDPDVHVEDRVWVEQMIRIGWRKPDGSL
jgi:hypothetical protein